MSCRSAARRDVSSTLRWWSSLIRAASGTFTGIPDGALIWLRLGPPLAAPRKGCRGGGGGAVGPRPAGTPPLPCTPACALTRRHRRPSASFSTQRCADVRVKRVPRALAHGLPPIAAIRSPRPPQAVCASDGFIHVVAVPSPDDVDAFRAPGGQLQPLPVGVGVPETEGPSRIQLAPAWSGMMAPGHKGRPCSVEVRWSE